MKQIFADSFYYLAILNQNDAAHRRAVSISETIAGRVVTTAWVLTEVADALAAPAQRPGFTTLLATLHSDPEVTIVPAKQSLFEAGTQLYSQRMDKNWSLTDCISFVVMHQNRINDALTGDRHFEQAGFRALLR